MANKEPYLFQNGNSESKSIKAHASANFNNAKPTQGESIPLICLPFAGVGPSFFKEWGTLTSGHLEIIAVQLPGREKRFVEEPYRDVATAVTGILPEVLERVGERDRVIIFGHSLGAVLAYELSHQLAKTMHIQVAHLVVSGSPAPWALRKRRATGLDDQAFLAQVREFAGYDHPALNDPDLRDMLLPVLRADVEMHENYCPSWNSPLPVSITSVRGTDDELVSREEAAQWHSATTMPLQVVELPGSHMYLTTSAGKLLRVIEELIEQTISASCN
jgi:surfactin synthase thioesterase subunit